MTPSNSVTAWRALLAACGVLIFIGGPMHPGGTMAEMLAHPMSFTGHALVFLGFVALVGALVAYGRQDVPARVRPWLRFAVVGAVVQAIEMAVHTMAYVDPPTSWRAGRRRC